MWVWYLGQEDHLAEEMTNHSSILSLKTPWTEEPEELQELQFSSYRELDMTE